MPLISASDNYQCTELLYGPRVQINSAQDDYTLTYPNTMHAPTHTHMHTPIPMHTHPNTHKTDIHHLEAAKLETSKISVGGLEQ